MEFTEASGSSSLSSFQLSEHTAGGGYESSLADYAASMQSELGVPDYVQLDEGYSLLADYSLTIAGELKAAVLPGSTETRPNEPERYAGRRKGHIKMMKRKSVEEDFRVGFRTKSEIEKLDDGYKWRKYGKKALKSSPNPRNYYRCANLECGVKKKVEREKSDPCYVITVYEGIHNHETPEETAAAKHPLLITCHHAQQQQQCQASSSFAIDTWSPRLSHGGKCLKIRDDDPSPFFESSCSYSSLGSLL
ncbi:putative WRKY transcription factor 50 [Apostasia shenzhenica]|uniref:Putative WRKY transcription factor 50 n=1 Tax=Apostasia shenzhenica TaxID=1088818 RepID=A0A2I0B799_9ASPA|nr:putative WRKY transcription factor 50 [Apostasia shenzhenica]